MVAPFPISGNRPPNPTRRRADREPGRAGVARFFRMVQEWAAMAAGHLIGLMLLVDAAPRGPASLVVNTGPDVTAPCPAGSMLASTLKRRLPAIRVATDASLAEGDLAVSVDARGDGWRLRVEGADGEAMLARDLRPGEPSCAAVAETATLILDRFLTAISWRGADPRLEADSLAGGRRPGGLDGLSLGAGLGAWTEVPWQVDPALAVDLSARLGRVLIGFWGAVPASERQVVRVGDDDRGRLRVNRAGLGTSIGGCRGGGGRRLQLCAGLQAGVGVLAGRADGTLFETRGARSVVPTAGVFGRVLWPLWWGLELDADGAALAALGRAQVGVEGTGAVRRWPRVQGLFSLRLAWRIW